MSRIRLLPATAESPAIARGLIRSELAYCDEETVTVAELLISELVTNAVVHGAGPIEVELRREADCVTAAVTDHGLGRPMPQTPDERDPHGRGLIIVRSLALDWGVHEAEAGTSVWFAIPIAKPSGGPAFESWLGLQRRLQITPGIVGVGPVDEQVERSHGEPRPSALAVALTLGAVVMAFILTWTTALRRPLFDDDWSYLNTVQQPGWWHSSTIWNPDNWLYRPVLFLWFGVLHSIFGLHALAYHIVTLAVVFLVGFLTWRISLAVGLKRGALVAGTVVILHAAVGYPVSWASAAPSPIAVAFALGAILLLLNRLLTLPRSVVAGLLLALGLLTREVVIVAPAVVVVVAWTRPGGKLRDALFRSLPLWIVVIGYVILRTAAGASNPPGPYHQSLSAHAFNNFFWLIVRASDVSGVSTELRGLAITALTLFMVGTIVWSLARRQYVILGGLAWFVLGTIPVIFLVNHSMDLYYIDFALPGLALAFGAACELVAAGLSDVLAIVAGVILLVVLGLVGHSVSNIEFTKEFGAHIEETQHLMAQVSTDYAMSSGTKLIVVHGKLNSSDEQAVTQGGDLFRVIFRDPSLEVRMER